MYVPYFGLYVDVLNVIHFWRNRSHPLVTYPETEVLEFLFIQRIISLRLLLILFVWVSIVLCLNILDCFLKFCAVKTCMSEMTHRALKILGIFCISCRMISRLLQTPVGSPWCSYFSMIVTGCLNTGQNYIWYNQGLSLVLICTWPLYLWSIYCAFLRSLI